LTTLWNENGEVDAARGSDLTVKDVVVRLREGSAGVVASIGQGLSWLRGNDLFSWWKTEAKPRLLDPEHESWRLEDLPDGRGWRASEWRLADDTTVVSFEEVH
jgi:hypothetical protein